MYQNIMYTIIDISLAIFRIFIPFVNLIQFYMNVSAQGFAKFRLIINTKIFIYVFFGNFRTQ